jgi:cyclopropane-fatty-acyl-phospholipid synthase
MTNKYRIIAGEIPGLAGIKIDGSHPWDIRGYNGEFYKRALPEGELGIGESYMDF